LVICPALAGSDQCNLVYKDLCGQVENWMSKDGEELPTSLGPKKFSGKLLLRVEPPLHRRLAAKAKATGESLNTFIARSLARGRLYCVAIRSA
jgi:hypothetical protein